MKPCGLLGEKLGHSFSPLIHSRFGSYPYKLFPTPREELDAFLKGRSFANLNVTIPYKKDVIPYCHALSPLAQEIGSVNTIKVVDDRLYGYNTDYFGFCHMLEKGKISVNGKKCAVIGNGGVAATVCVALKRLGADTITVVTRQKNTPEFIKTIADHTIVINTSPVGMYPGNGRSPLDLRLFQKLDGVADLIYNPLKTALMLQAEELGIPCVGGLPMLVAQAKQASEIFTGRKISKSLLDEVTKEIEFLCRNIILIGMPGCGKSTIGKKIANALNRPFYDTDSLIEEREGKAIPRVFAEDGEDHFRALETEVLTEISALSGAVISTGGGIIKKQENHSLLRQNGLILLIDRPLQMLSTNGRPLSSSVDAVAKLYKERLPIYRMLAHHTIDNSCDIEHAVNDILCKIK